MEKARSMISGARLGQEFWAETMGKTCHLVKKSPLSALEYKTPQELWSGKKPSLSHLRGYKLWNLVIRKVLYSRDVVFREVKDFIKHEVQPKEPEKIEFELKEEESDSTTEEKSEDEEPQTLGVRRSVQERRIVKEAVDSEDGKVWKEAMLDEIASSHKNEASDIVDFPAGRKPIGRIWVFKKKTNVEGKVEKYKARLVAKGYLQVL
eukprot:PITA_26513